MPLNIPGRVVVFDYGEVISLSPTSEDRDVILTVAGISAADAPAFWAAYDRHRDELDRGNLDVPAYWARVGGDLGLSWSGVDVQRLWTVDFRGWISVEPGTLDLIAQLHAGGTRLAILSNAGFDFASPLRFSPLGSYFERVFVSAEMNALKPEPGIYLEVAAELGITMAEMIFVDNKAVNTDAAAALGATTHHFTGVEGLRDFLHQHAG